MDPFLAKSQDLQWFYNHFNLEYPFPAGMFEAVFRLFLACRRVQDCLTCRHAVGLRPNNGLLVVPRVREVGQDGRRQHHRQDIAVSSRFYDILPSGYGLVKGFHLNLTVNPVEILYLFLCHCVAAKPQNFFCHNNFLLYCSVSGSSCGSEEFPT